jgi:hypothetical protein
VRHPLVTALLVLAAGACIGEVIDQLILAIKRASRERAWARGEILPTNLVRRRLWKYGAAVGLIIGIASAVW